MHCKRYTSILINVVTVSPPHYPYNSNSQQTGPTRHSVIFDVRETSLYIHASELGLSRSSQVTGLSTVAAYCMHLLANHLPHRVLDHSNRPNCAHRSFGTSNATRGTNGLENICQRIGTSNPCMSAWLRVPAMTSVCCIRMWWWWS